MTTYTPMTANELTAWSDWKFCESHPEEFLSQGKFSMTKALRTVAAMNDKLTRAEFVSTFVPAGFNRNTLVKQFGISRANDVRWYGKTLNSDGTLSR